MTIRGSDSLLASVARRRQALSAAKKSLGLGTERGAPQAPTRTPTPPPQLPARGEAPAGGPAQAPDEDGRRERLLQAIQERIPDIARRNAPQEEPIQVREAKADSEPLAQQVQELGGVGLSAEQQFYRVAGRLPSPQEISVFRARLMLEEQLQRPPTANELRGFILRPQSPGPSFPAAVEGS